MRAGWWVVVAVLVALGPQASAQTADDIIEKYLAARGGVERLKGIQTIRITGTMTMGPGLDVPFVLELKRPSMMRLDFTVQGTTGTQAFDGSTGWVLMPFAGITRPDPMPAEAIKDAQAQADFDGPLVDYRAKGNRVDLLGQEPVGDREAYKLNVTLKNGAVRTMFIDTMTLLEIKSEGTRTFRGTTVESDEQLGDYKPVDGIMFPHIMDSGIKGVSERQKMNIEQIELNVPMEDGHFKMPDGQKPGGDR